MNELRKIAALAEADYCPVVPHNCNGPVCTAASIHAAACMASFRMLEYIPVDTDNLIGRTRNQHPYRDHELCRYPGNIDGGGEDALPSTVLRRGWKRTRVPGRQARPAEELFVITNR